MTNLNKQVTTILDVRDDAVDVLDLDNPRSMMNILPDKLREHALLVPRHLWYKSEGSLKDLSKPDFTDKCLRVNFWQAYCYAQDNHKSINLNHIVSGVTTKNYFWHICEEFPEKLAFIMTPPKQYDVMQRQILDEGLERLRDVVEMDFYDEKVTEKEGKNGQMTLVKERKINASAIAEVRKVVEMLQDRVQGSVIRKVAVKGQFEGGGIPNNQQAISGGDNIAALLAAVSSKLDKAEGGGEVIDAEPS